MTLKQIQEEELKKFDALMGEIGHKTITTGRPVDAEAIVKQFLLSAMESSARGAIEETRQQLLKAVEEMKFESLSSSSPMPYYHVGYEHALKQVIDLLQAKDYMERK